MTSFSSPIYPGGTVEIVDTDSADFNQGWVEVELINSTSGDRLFFSRNHGFNLSGTVLTYQSIVIGVRAEASPTHLRFEFNENVNPQLAEDVLKHIYLRDTAQVSMSSQRVARISVSDGDGEHKQAYVTLKGNAPPTLTVPVLSTVKNGVGNPTYFAIGSNVENDGETFGGGILAITLDTPGAGDGLYLNARSQIQKIQRGIYYNGLQIATQQPTLSDERVFTLTDKADSEAVEVLLSHLYYRNSLSENINLADRQLTYSLTDGQGANAIAQQAIILNAAPVLSGESTQTVRNLQSPVYPAAHVKIADSDSLNFDGGYLEVELTAYSVNDNLYFSKYDGFSVSNSKVYYNGMLIAVRTISSSNRLKFEFNENVDASLAENLLKHIYIRNTSQETDTSTRVIKIVINDGDGKQDVLAAEVKVDSPVISSPAYYNIVNGSENPSYFAASFSLQNNSNSLKNGTISITLVNAQSGDSLYFSRSNGFSMTGRDVYFDGVHIATRLSSQSNTVKFTLTESATKSIVEKLVANIYYRNTLAPEDVSRVDRLITYEFSNESGGHATANQIVNFNVRPKVNIPVKIEVSDTTTPIFFATGGAVLDEDSPDFAGGFLDVRIDISRQGDVLGFSSANGIVISGSDVWLGQSKIGTDLVISNLSYTLNLTSTATPAVVKSLLECFYMVSETNTPSVYRQFEITLNDGVGGTTTAGVYFGDVISIAILGQSNAGGYFTNYQNYTGTLGSQVLDQDDLTFRDMTDPTNSYRMTHGSVWPLLANLLEAELGKPVRFISASKGGTALVDGEWDPELDGEYYEIALNRMKLAGELGVDRIDAILWDQGETDIGNRVSQSSYTQHLMALSDAIDHELGYTIPFISAQTGTMPNANLGEYVDMVRRAQSEAWDLDSNIYPGPTGMDRPDYHWQTDVEAVTLAGRWFFSIMDTLSTSSYGRGPRLVDATISSQNTYIDLTFDQDLLSTDTTFGPTAFELKNDGVPVKILSAVRSGVRQVRLTLESSVTPSSLSLSFGKNSAAAAKNLPKSVAYQLPVSLHGISEVSMPAEAFYDVAVNPAS